MKGMLVRDIEKALLHAEHTGFGFGPMTLSKSAVVHLCRRLEPREDGVPLHLVELGGGQSTVFWTSLVSLGLLDVRVTTLEHNVAWAAELKNRIHHPSIEVIKQSLKQAGDEEWKKMFADPGLAPQIWEEHATEVGEELHSHYTIRNAFYGEAHKLELAAASLDALIVDGPHGNGRSLVFPLFAEALKPGSLILIDDFDHYPFLDDLGIIFRYEELYREYSNEKRWVLVKALERVSRTSE
jgi:hypothetical protein